MQRALRKVHLWLGLIGGVFIAVMGLSGFVIVFRPMLENSAVPRLSGGAAVGSSLAAIQQTLSVQLGGARISRIVFPEAQGEALLVQAEGADKQRLQVFVDPMSGSVLGEKKRQAWLDWVISLHQNLLMGRAGRALTGVIGIALLLLSGSGAVSWLAGRRDWKRAISLLTAGGPLHRASYQWHVWAGFWTNLLMLAVSLTGIVLAYQSTFQGQPAARPRASRTASGDLLPLNEYVRAAVAAVPGGVIRELRLSGGRGAVSATLWAPGDIRPRGGSVVSLDRSSARVLSIEHSSSLIDLVTAIHKTELGGWPVKVAWSLLGLAPTLLMLSGLQIWWWRRRASNASARSQARK